MTTNPKSSSDSNGPAMSQNPSWHTPERAAAPKANFAAIDRALDNSRAAELAKQEEEEYLRTTTPEERARRMNLVIKAVYANQKALELED